jgi:hypothetical protein
VRCCWRSVGGRVFGRGAGWFRFGSGWLGAGRAVSGWLFRCVAEGRSLRAGGSVGRFVWGRVASGGLFGWLFVDAVGGRFVAGRLFG